MERTWAPDKGEAPEAVGNYKCQRVRSYDTCDKYEVALIARPLTFNWLNANTVFGGPCTGCLQMGCSNAPPSFIRISTRAWRLRSLVLRGHSRCNRYNYCHSVGTKSPKEAPCHESSPFYPCAW